MSDQWYGLRFDLFLEQDGIVYKTRTTRYGGYSSSLGSESTDMASFIFYGPGTLKIVTSIESFIRVANDSYWTISHSASPLPVRLTYYIEEMGSTTDESKFSVSLDDDGDRVAVGYKDKGSNAVVRVYEFSNGSWDQLGEDVE